MPKLTPKDALYLTIEIEEKKYNIPLAQTLKLKEIRKLMKALKGSEEDQLEAMFDFFGAYMGEDILDEMTTADVMEIFDLWKKANDTQGGPSLGESSASHS